VDRARKIFEGRLKLEKEPSLLNSQFSILLNLRSMFGLRFILHHVYHLDQKPGVLVFNLCICHTGDSAKLSMCYRCSSLAF
jgi:hypothetical protein